MKKKLLSLAVILTFGLYAFSLRSGGVSAKLSKKNPVATELNTKQLTENLKTNTQISTSPTPVNTTTSTTFIKKENCVYIPSISEDNEEEYSDDEEKERKGYYKCTTILVPTTTTTSQTPPATKPTTPSTAPPSSPPVVATPPPAIKPKTNSIWKNGTFIGDSVDAYYGNVQVSATILNDRISSISFLDYPQDRNASLQRSNYAIPILKQEAISAQSAKVNTISGVTYTSEAFMASLSSALAQAKI